LFINQPRLYQSTVPLSISRAFINQPRIYQSTVPLSISRAFIKHPAGEFQA